MIISTEIYTYSERTIKKFRADDAINFARQLLKDKYGITTICVKALKGNNFKELTTAELSELVEEMVQDTLYFELG